MKIIDETMSLATVCFASTPGFIGLGRPGFKTVWHRAKGATTWIKEQTGATKTSAQMAAALRWFATQPQWNLKIDAATARACIVPREGYVRPPKVPGPFIAYWCAGCGAIVARRHRATEGEPVWCGGRRCTNTFTVRLDPDHLQQDLERLIRRMPGIEAPDAFVTIRQQ
jgi:hypothetical protein